MKLPTVWEIYPVFQTSLLTHQSTGTSRRVSNWGLSFQEGINWYSTHRHTKILYSYMTSSYRFNMHTISTWWLNTARIPKGKIIPSTLDKTIYYTPQAWLNSLTDYGLKQCGQYAPFHVGSSMATTKITNYYFFQPIIKNILYILFHKLLWHHRNNLLDFISVVLRKWYRKYSKCKTKSD